MGDARAPVGGVGTIADATRHDAPGLSVVVVTASDGRSLRRTLRHLREQTIQRSIEVIVVAPSADAVAGEQVVPDGFHAVRRVGAGPITNVDRAAAHGIRVAAAPIVAMIEDHAYPAPDWAAALLRAFEGPWSVVGPAVSNANPASTLSWASHLLAYGQFMEPVSRGEMPMVSRHNVAFRRAALQPYMPALGTLLGRGGGLFQRMSADGHRFYLAADARVDHANPSRLASLAELHFLAGRVIAAHRWRRENWPAARRALYVLCAPLFPVLRLRQILPKLRDPRHAGLVPKVAPALLLALLVDAAGQALGFAFGSSPIAEHRLEAFEYNRLRHTSAADAVLLAE